MSSYREKGIEAAMEAIFGVTLQSASVWSGRGPAKVLEIYEWAIRDSIRCYKRRGGIPFGVPNEGTEEERQEFYSGFYSVVLEAEKKYR